MRPVRLGWRAARAALVGCLAAAPAIGAGCSAAAAVAAGPFSTVSGPRGPAPIDGWTLPVPGRVVRPFAAPRCRWCPGHRGADLAAAAGTQVGAANDGVVAFAGEVAGSLHVVVDHGGGLRTSSSFLASVAVRQGQQVRRGQVLGTTGGHDGDHDGSALHLGLRIGDRYVDPMVLFAPLDLSRIIRLAPLHDQPADPGPWPSSVRSVTARLPVPTALARATGSHDAALDVLGALGDAAGSVAGALGAAGGVVGGAAADALHGATGAAGPLWSPIGAAVSDAVEIGRRLADWVRSRVTCSDAEGRGSGPPGSGHRVLAVGGIDSSTDPRTGATFRLDAGALGYRGDEVRWFSYAPRGGPYGRSATWSSLVAQGLRVRDELRAMQREQPGREVDLVAHSQGGVVVDVFLQHVYRADDPTLPPIGTVVTLAAPHHGVPLATATRDLRSEVLGRAALEVTDAVTGGAAPPATSSVVGQLAEDSALVRGLWRRGLPDHVDFTSIAGVDDVLVPANRTAVPGGRSVTVDPAGVSDHGAIVEDPSAMRAARAALEGRPPPCTSLADGVRGAVEPVVVSRVEHAAGSLARAATAGGRP